MDEEADFIRSEIPDVASIVRQECWLEGERRGGAVDPTDISVQKRVADIILDGVGAQIRERHQRGKGKGTAADS